jgi:hypothetical protein
MMAFRSCPRGGFVGNSTSYHFPAAAGRRRPSESRDGRSLSVTRPRLKSMARPGGEGSRPRVAPRIPPRAPRATRACRYLACLPAHCWQKVRCAHSKISRARLNFESCAVRERQVARPVSRHRAARPTGPPIARNCGARRHPPSCVSEYQRRGPPALQDAASLRLPIRAPGLAMPTAQARMTRERGLHAIRSRIRSDNDTSSLLARAKDCAQILLVPMASCVHERHWKCQS